MSNQPTQTANCQYWINTDCTWMLCLEGTALYARRHTHGAWGRWARRSTSHQSFANYRPCRPNGQLLDYSRNTAWAGLDYMARTALIKKANEMGLLAERHTPLDAATDWAGMSLADQRDISSIWEMDADSENVVSLLPNEAKRQLWDAFCLWAPQYLGFELFGRAANDDDQQDDQTAYWAIGYKGQPNLDRQQALRSLWHGYRLGTEWGLAQYS